MVRIDRWDKRTRERKGVWRVGHTRSGYWGWGRWRTSLFKYSKNDVNMKACGFVSRHNRRDCRCEVPQPLQQWSSGSGRPSHLTVSSCPSLHNLTQRGQGVFLFSDRVLVFNPGWPQILSLLPEGKDYKNVPPNALNNFLKIYSYFWQFHTCKQSVLIICTLTPHPSPPNITPLPPKLWMNLDSCKTVYMTVCLVPWCLP